MTWHDARRSGSPRGLAVIGSGGVRRMAVLEVWSSRGRGDIVALTEPSYLIGSDPTSAQIALDDATVSGVHAAVERIAPTWLVRDLGSRNGTRVGHERLVGQR